MLPGRFHHVDTTDGPDILGVNVNVNDDWPSDYEDLICPGTPSPTHITRVAESPPQPEPTTKSQASTSGAVYTSNTKGAFKVVKPRRQKKAKLHSDDVLDSPDNNDVLKAITVFTVEMTGIGVGDFKPQIKSDEDKQNMLRVITAETTKQEIKIEQKRDDIVHSTAQFVDQTKDLLTFETELGILLNCYERISHGKVSQGAGEGAM
jgi:hypothetical protein